MDPAQGKPAPAISAGGVELAPGVVVPGSAVEFTFARSSGLGGQNVNKLATKAQLRVDLAAVATRIGPGATARLRALAGASRLTAAGELLLTSDESRSQHANRQACLDRLRLILLEALRPPRPRRPTRPTAGSRRRRIESKKKRAAIKSGRRNPREEG